MIFANYLCSFGDLFDIVSVCVWTSINVCVTCFREEDKRRFRGVLGDSPELLSSVGRYCLLRVSLWKDPLNIQISSAKPNESSINNAFANAKERYHFVFFLSPIFLETVRRTCSFSEYLILSKRLTRMKSTEKSIESS